MDVKAPVRVNLADILVLGSLASKVPAAIAWYIDPDGSLLAVSHGFGAWQPQAHDLLDLLTAHPGVIEISELSAVAPTTKLIAPPHCLKWMFGTAIRDSNGHPFAALALLDRTVRQPTGTDHDLLRVLQRRLKDAIANPRPAPPSQSAPPQQPRTLPSATARPAPAPSTAVADKDRLIRTSDVADLFAVSERTVINWVSAGKLPTIRTVGGHLRFRQTDVARLLSA